MQKEYNKKSRKILSFQVVHGIEGENFDEQINNSIVGGEAAHVRVYQVHQWYKIESNYLQEWSWRDFPIKVFQKRDLNR